MKYNKFPCYGFSYNDIFRHLLLLTQLNEDSETLIKLFSEQGIEICEKRIEMWSYPKGHINFRPIPEKIFSAFMNVLHAINNEALSSDINMFDLRDIFQDTRTKDSGELIDKISLAG